MLSSRRLGRFKQVISQRHAGLTLVLEDIHDPHNAAAILRTCDGLGIQEVHFIFDQEKPYNPRKIGKVSSSSANKWLTISTYRSTAECFKALKKKKYIIFATTLRPGAKDLRETNFTKGNVALVVSNEHRGISEHASTHADHLIYFPMQGFVESFNVSVSAALFLYEITRQRRPGRASLQQGGHLMSATEQKKLLADFKKR